MTDCDQLAPAVETVTQLAVPGGQFRRDFRRLWRNGPIRVVEVRLLAFVGHRWGESGTDKSGRVAVGAAANAYCATPD